MANKREVFTILELSTGEGVGLVGQVAGGAVSTEKKMPVIGGMDAAGNYIMEPVRASGDSAAAVPAKPSLAAKDLAGLLQFLSLRDEGAASSGVDALVSMIAKDLTGALKYLKVNADGELITSSESAGTPVFGDDVVTGVLNTATTVVTLALTVDKVYEKIEFAASNSFPTVWEIIWNNNAALTTLLTISTGSGKNHIKELMQYISFTAGSTGTQQLLLKGTQLQGVASDLNGYLGVLEKA